MNPNNYLKQRERALIRKLEMIDMKGGKCEVCGYDKNIAALDFHHLNPEEKGFQLDARHLSNTNYKKLKEELDKCILVCANCHREIHNKGMEKENIPLLLEQLTSVHKSVLKENKVSVCEECGKTFEYISGKRYCSKECREKAKKYPSKEELYKKYDELKSWEKVASFYDITRKITQRIRKI